jgi:ribonuclease HI
MSFPQASNNEAEYEALLHGMKIAKACGATRLKIFRDSNLVVQEVMNQCDAISDIMTAYRNLYYYLEGTFNGCEVSHVSRASNEEADNLANIERSIKRSDNRLGGWQARNRKHNRTRGSHDDQRNLDAAILGVYDKQNTTQRYSQSKKDNTTIQSFCRTLGEVVREKHNCVLQRCVTSQEGQDILKDIHAGVCGHHASSRAIAAKAFRAGFYWLTAIEDAKDIVRRCKACQ